MYSVCCQIFQQPQQPRRKPALINLGLIYKSSPLVRPDYALKKQQTNNQKNPQAFLCTPSIKFIHRKLSPHVFYADIASLLQCLC